MPVSRGPKLCVQVFTTLIKPIIAVRWAFGSAAARKAERGATSMDWEQERRIRKANARGRAEGMGMRERAMVEGR